MKVKLKIILIYIHNLKLTKEASQKKNLKRDLKHPRNKKN